jgi:Papain-like cysteine protease AvrRpt2
MSDFTTMYTDGPVTDACCCDDGYDMSYDPTYDSNYDMAVEPGIVTFDSDFNGVDDTAFVDTNLDGAADAVAVLDEVTGETVALVDSDLDGTFDTALTDSEGDGVFEETTTITEDQLNELDDPAAITDLSVEEPATVTVEDDPNIHGDPMADITYHQAQPGPVDCLPTSVSMIVSEVTGETVDAGEVVDLANDLGVMTETGMAPADGVTLLEHYGVDASLETGTLDDLRTMLDEGGNVIIGLDSADLYAQADGPFADDVVSGHAVVITGIDDEQGLVYINDPGFPDGAGVAIPIDEFEDAWQDTENTMIVIEDEVDAETPANVAGTGDTALLPLMFRVLAR